MAHVIMSNSGLQNTFSGNFVTQGPLLAGNFINGSVNIQENDPCLRALRITDPRADKDRIIASKDELLKEASAWIFQDLNFIQWRDTDVSLLWLKGDPGKGKTMLMFTLIEYISERKASMLGTNGSSDMTAKLSYFIFQATDPRLNSSTSAIRGIIYLLIEEQPELLAILQREYDKAGSDLFTGPNAFFELKRILQEMLGCPGLPMVYLLVDALDECLTGLSDLLDLIGTEQKKVKWIVSSRNRPEIEARFRKSRLRLSLEVNQQHVSLAVRSFIDSKLRKLSHLHDDDEDMRTALANSLLQKAEGTFLWVSLVCKVLESAEPWDVQLILEDMPSGLEPLYERMMEQIENNRQNNAFCKQVLRVVTLGFRPMHLREIDSSIDHPKGVTFRGTWLGRLIKLCGSFLTIRDDMVYFVHQSAKDYFSTGLGSRFMPDQKHHHGQLAIRLLNSMSMTLKVDLYGLGLPGAPIKETDVAIQNITPIKYACCYWVDHINETDNRDLYLSDSGPVFEFLQTFILQWFEALSLMGNIREGILKVLQLNEMIDSTSSPLLSGFVLDAYRFIRSHSGIIEQAPLQTYISALIFSPNNSNVRKGGRNLLPTWLTQLPMVEDEWHSSLMTLGAHTESVMGIAFSVDGRKLVSCSMDGTIRLWDARTGAVLAIYDDHSRSVRTVECSPDGKHIASGSDDKTIRLWDMTTGECTMKLKGHSHPVMAIAFSPDGRQLASSSRDKTIRLWNIATGVCTVKLEGHLDSVNGVTFLSDGKQLVSSSKDKTLRLWDLTTGACMGTLWAHSNEVKAVAFSPNTMQLASTAGSAIRLWTVTNETAIPGALLEGHLDAVFDLAFSPNGSLLASGSRDKTLRLWDMTTGEAISTLFGHSFPIYAVKFSEDGTQLASGSMDHTIRLWDVSTSAISATLKGHQQAVSEMAFSMDGRYLASGSHDKKILVRDMTIEGANAITLEGHLGAIRALNFSSDGRYLASCSSDITIRLWDKTKGWAEVITLEGHSERVNISTFSPDGRYLASQSSDMTIRLWDMTKGWAEVLILEDHSRDVETLVFSPDRMYLASASRLADVRLWDITKMETTKSILEDHLVVWDELEVSAVSTLVFSADGRHFAAGSTGGRIKIWDLSTRNLIASFQSSLRYLTTLAFSPDGRQLTSRAGDEVRTWTIDSIYQKAKDRFIDNYDGVLINTTADDSPMNFQPTITVKGGWILINNIRYIWLPYEYRILDSYWPRNTHRGSVVITKNNLLAIGTGMGRVVYFQFDFSKLPR